MNRFTCPCCGYRTLPGPPGTEELCAICGWRDDVMHLRFPSFNGLPNGISLIDAQLNYTLIGAKDAQAAKAVRFPSKDDERDPDWRPIDPDSDAFEDVPVDFDGLAEPADLRELYYWLPKPA